MFARFDENPAMTLRVIKETKRYGQTHAQTDGQTDGRTDGQRENSIPPTNKVCGGYNYPEGKELRVMVYRINTIISWDARLGMSVTTQGGSGRQFVTGSRRNFSKYRFVLLNVYRFRKT